MAKKKGLTYEEKMINALNTLPNPLEDTKHRIFIIFENDRARSGQSRFEHIIMPRHELKPTDIQRISKKINVSILRMDKERTNTYNLYVPRYSYKKEYIKLSLELDFRKSNIGKVKTIYITKSLK